MVETCSIRKKWKNSGLYTTASAEDNISTCDHIHKISITSFLSYRIESLRILVSCMFCNKRINTLVGQRDFCYSGSSSSIIFWKEYWNPCLLISQNKLPKRRSDSVLLLLRYSLWYLSSGQSLPQKILRNDNCQIKKNPPLFSAGTDQERDEAGVSKGAQELFRKSDNHQGLGAFRCRTSRWRKFVNTCDQ